MIEDFETLAHHGVKGMKWGVRKSRLKKTFSKKNIKRMIDETDKAEILKNVVSAGLGAAATAGVIALTGNPAISGMGVAAVQTVLMQAGNQQITDASQRAVVQLSRVLAHDAFDDEYLAHHGVKGMKWGVRHDKSSAYRTANRMLKRDEKATQLRDRISAMEQKQKTKTGSDKVQLKRAKYIRKLGKYERRAGKRAFTDFGIHRRVTATRKASKMRSKIQKIDEGGQSYQRKKIRLTAKANRLERRNKRAAKRLSKQVRTLTFNDLTKEQMAIGKKYAAMVTT